MSWGVMKLPLPRGVYAYINKWNSPIKDTVLAQVQRCMLHGCPSQEPNYRRSAAELEEAIVECAGWLCTLGCESGCSTTRKRASNPGTVQDTCTPRHWKDEKVGKKPWCGGRASMEIWKPKCKPQSSRPLELISCPDPFAHARKSVWYSE